MSRSSDYYRSVTKPSSLSPQEFEEYISFLLRELGYKIRRRGRLRDADGGVDIDAWKDGRHILVQCKRYRTSWVHHGHVRDLLGAVMLESADAGWLVSTGRFTGAAIRAGKKTSKIELFGPRKIKSWQKRASVGPYLPAPKPDSVPARQPELRPSPPIEAAPESPKEDSPVIDSAPVPPVNGSQSRLDIDAEASPGSLKKKFQSEVELSSSYRVNPVAPPQKTVFGNLGFNPPVKSDEVSVKLRAVQLRPGAGLPAEPGSLKESSGSRNFKFLFIMTLVFVCMLVWLSCLCAPFFAVPPQ